MRSFGAARPEAAATRAIAIGNLTYGSVRSILDHKLERDAPQPPANSDPVLHANICGSAPMRRNPLALEKDLNGLRRQPHLDLVARETMRDTIEVSFDLDVVFDANPPQAHSAKERACQAASSGSADRVPQEAR